MRFMLLFASLLLSNCTTQAPTARTFANAFPAIIEKDTLLFALAAGEGMDAPMATTDTLATAVFYEEVPDSIRAVIEHILGADTPTIIKLGRFSLDSQFDGLSVDIKAFWFRNQSILIFDKEKQQVTGLFPVAEFFGGDGGQNLRQSWLLTNKDGSKALIVRDSGHSLILEENAAEPQDVYAESVAKYLWQQGAFVPQPISDSIALIQQFPVKWE